MRKNAEKTPDHFKTSTLAAVRTACLQESCSGCCQDKSKSMLADIGQLLAPEVIHCQGRTKSGALRSRALRSIALRSRALSYRALRSRALRPIAIRSRAIRSRAMRS